MRSHSERTSPMSSSILYLGLDVHKESVTIAVLPADAPAPTRLERLPYDLKKLQRFCTRLAQGGMALRGCYEASSAGYVLQRAMTSWGHVCEIVASALIPKKPGERRKFDKKRSEERREGKECRSRWS